MQTFGSSGATGAAEPESDIHPALRSYRALSSVLSLALGGFFVLILMKGWERLSAGAVSWMGFSFLWTVLVFREAHITNGRLRTILALAQVEPVDKKLLDKVLNVTTEGANRTLYLSCLAFLGLWMAISTILSKHHPW